MFEKLFSAGVGSILSSIRGILDDNITSKEEKEAIELKIQRLLIEREKEVEETYRKELDSRADIIKAEMAQGDSFTKRARPTVIYMGLLFIFCVHVAAPLFSFYSSQQVPELSLPDQFWNTYATIVSVYAAGRSLEKSEMSSKVGRMITGNKKSTTK